MKLMDTGYASIADIGQPKAGETVVVAAASGAVGAVAGQLAKRAGARVVGIAGGAEKCRYVEGELGFLADLLIGKRNLFLLGSTASGKTAFGRSALEIGRTLCR